MNFYIFCRTLSCAFFFFLTTSCGLLDDSDALNTSDLISSIESENLDCSLVNSSLHPNLLKPFPGKTPVGMYEGNHFNFAIFNLPKSYSIRNIDSNESLIVLRNENLVISGFGKNSEAYVRIFENIKAPMTLNQLGLFIYPLGTCILITIFISSERIYSLRSGLTFPRKIAKALQSGEFPNRNWKKRSSAERIVWVATKEKPSIDSLRSYSRLEIAALERGLFLLEVVVSAAPLLGLLGTVTGLVQVFSQIPAGGGVGDTAVFSEGIAMALLTTIVGLSIAIPTLILHSSLVRLIEKRASSLDWLTERLVDAIYPSNVHKNIDG